MSTPALPRLETTRLVVRRLEGTDHPAVHAYTSQPEVMAYIPEGPMSAEQTRAFVGKNEGDNPEAYAIARRTDGALVGHLIFHRWFAPRTYEVGWVIDPRSQREGYATEAAQVAMTYAFEDLHAHRVIATCQPENTASYRVMEKLGMRREGHFRRCIHRGGDVWWDEYFYALLEEEWFAR
jgi:RimJ/RimL family protein N-acetyltransferase